MTGCASELIDTPVICPTLRDCCGQFLISCGLRTISSFGWKKCIKYYWAAAILYECYVIGRATIYHWTDVLQRVSLLHLRVDLWEKPKSSSNRVLQADDEMMSICNVWMICLDFRNVYIYKKRSRALKLTREPITEFDMDHDQMTNGILICHLPSANPSSSANLRCFHSWSSRNYPSQFRAHS